MKSVVVKTAVIAEKWLAAVCFRRKRKSGWKNAYQRHMYRHYRQIGEWWPERRQEFIRKMTENQPELVNDPRALDRCLRQYRLCAVFLGANIEDWLSFHLYEENWQRRSRYICEERLQFIMRYMNDQSQIRLTVNKDEFAAHWHDFYKRPWCVFRKGHPVSEDRFMSTFAKTRKLIVKPLDGMGGEGIHTLDAEDLQEAYRILSRTETDVITEQYIEQKGFFHELNPSSLNTVRVCTIRLEQPEVLFAECRVGHPGAVVDNSHAGGSLFEIDKITGRMDYGTDYRGNHIPELPGINQPVHGTRIPEYEKIISFCKDAHRIAPEGLHIIGWDVCYSDDGLYMIEGNTCPGFGLVCSHNEDPWGMMKNYLTAYDRKYGKNKTMLKRIKRKIKQFISLPKEIRNLRREVTALKETVRQDHIRLEAMRKKEEQLYLQNVPSERIIQELADWFHQRTGETLDLIDPVTYCQKIQWLKIYDSTPLKTRLADKVQVREYVKEKAGEKYLTKLYGVWNTFDEIDPDTLPESFVLKANHGSGYNYPVPDRKAMNRSEARRKFAAWMAEDYTYVYGFEFQYRDIPRMILAEEYLHTKSGQLSDYKITCMNGIPRFIQYIERKETKDIEVAVYDTSWKRMPFTFGQPAVKKEIPRPENLEEMLRIAEALSQDTALVRVDLYLLDNGEIRFGELTFTPASGGQQWKYPEYNRILGDMLKLPPKYYLPGLNYDFEKKETEREQDRNTDIS